eukprot:TRINITY_DN4702_c0_g1_i4.p1 TRINITY_DN4702_c0_g1~~TRINITY_DN4702_c0_g1_i4.p1  ORF type:complete len:1820 (-),score=442.98 TRINITY_DN4702_c0_g1_i4:21-5480(-)
MFSDLEVLRGPLSSHILEILDFFAALLARLADLVDQNHGHTYVQEEAGESVGVLKALIIIEGNFQSVIQEQLKVLLRSDEATPSLQTFSSLARALIKYGQSSTYPKDAIWGGILSLVLLINCSGILPKHDELYFTFFAGGSKRGNFRTLLSLLLPDYDLVAELPNFPLLSRIYFLRALITASTNEVLLAPVDVENGISSLLLDHIFPRICKYCEYSTDRFIRFSGLQTLQECVNKILAVLKEEQLKASSLPGNQALQRFSTFFDHFFEEVMEFVWKNWEDPFEPVVDQTKQIFSAMLEIFDLSCLLFGETHPRLNSLKQTLTRDLTAKFLGMDWLSKAKYTSLTILFNRIGARNLLSVCPDFPMQLFASMIDTSVQCAAAGLFEVFLHTLDQEYPKDKEEESRSLWLPSLVEVLASPKFPFHKSIVTHALPCVFKNHPQNLGALLRAISSRSRSVTASPEFKELEDRRTMKSMLSVLKIARKMKLITSESLPSILTDSPISTRSLVESALTQEDEDVCVDALELICISFKDTEEPSQFEREMVKSFLLFNLKTTSNRNRQETVVNIRKFLQRLKESTRQKSKEEKKQRNIVRTESAVYKAVDFVNWTCRVVQNSLYPGVPFARQHISLLIYQAVIDVWGPNPSDKSPAGVFLEGYSLDIFSKDFSKCVVHLLWERFDAARHLAYDILNMFPRNQALPGFEVEWFSIMKSAVKLLYSPRSRECESGAFICLLALNKYAAELNWSFKGLHRLHYEESLREVVVQKTKETQDTNVVDFFNEILLITKDHVSFAATNLIQAAKDRPMHGPLLALRNLVASVDFSVESRKAKSRWQEFFTDLLQVVHKVVDITFKVVADVAPEGYTTSGSWDSSSTSDYSSPTGQMIAVASWNSIKEVSQLLGAISKHVPFPTHQDDREALLSVQQIQSIGQLFVKILLSTRHVGAIEKSHTAYQVLCEQLMQCKVPALHKLPAVWVDNLFASAKSTEQITRRSAGLPYGFCAILRAEVYCQGINARVLVPKVMNTLIALASGPDLEREKDGRDKYRSQVHAINVLFFIFGDRDLSQAVEQYLVDAIKIMLDGYKSPNWAVRNSASMMFSSLVERSIKPKRRKDDQSKYNGTTFKEFFGHFPSLHPFLLHHLQTCTEENVSVEGDSPEQNSEREILQSSLYAVLLILSKMFPSVMGDSTSEKLSPTAFIPLVRRCSTKSNYMVRQIAALALVPLVSSVELPRYLTELIDSIPDRRGPGINHNVVHGVLLQIQQLLAGHLAQQVVTKETEQEVLYTILPNLQRKFWLLSPRANPCAPLSALLFNIVQDFYPEGEAKARAVALANEAVSSLPIPNRIVVSSSESLVSATKLVLCSEANKRASLSQALPMLVHRDYEVRLFTLKYLAKQVLPSANLNLEELTEIHERLFSLIFTETHHQCLKQIFKIIRTSPQLSKFPFPLSQMTSNQKWIDLWDLLQKRLTSSAMTEVIAFCGFFYQKWWNAHPRGKGITEFMERMCAQWKVTISTNSDSVQMLDLRFASAISAIHALEVETKDVDDIHQQNEKEALVSAWLVCVRLLQDEDEELRHYVARFVSSKLLRSKNTFFTIFKASRAQELIYAHLHKHFAFSATYFDHLWKAIFVGSSQSQFSDSSQSHRLFEKEEDNNFEEELFIIQLSSCYLLASLSEINRVPTEEKVYTEDNWHLKQATLLVNQFRDHVPQETQMWSRFVTYKPDVFLPLYRCSMGIFVFTSLLSGFKKSELSSALFERVQGIIDAFPSEDFIHPLVLQLLQRALNLTRPTTRSASEVIDLEAETLSRLAVGNTQDDLFFFLASDIK